MVAGQHENTKAGWGRSTVLRSFAVLLVGALAATSLTVGAGPAAAAGAGTADAAFNTTAGTGLNSYVQAIAQQSDGKLLVGGSFFEYNGQPRSALVRLNVDGSLDSTFVQTGAGITGVVDAIAVQPDGRIVVGGSFDLYNGIARKKILRLEATGALDLTFAQTGAGLDGAVNDLALVPGGKILVSGYFAHYAGAARSRIAQLTSTGALDATFDPSSGFDQDVYTISRASNGDVWAGGPFTTYRGLPVSHVVRIPANGGAAYPAPSSAGLGAVYDIEQTPSGQVLVGGLHVMARYSSAGVLDPSFAPVSASLPSYVFTIGQQGDGKIVIGGRTGLTGWVGRLTSTGALDPGYPSGPRANDNVTSAVIQESGAAVIVGNFTTIDGGSFVRIARLLPDPAPVTVPGLVSTLSLTFKRGALKLGWTAPASNGGAVITGYQFRISKPNSKTKFRAWKSAGSLTSKVTKMVKGAKYRVQIRAVNAAGPGPVLAKGFKQRR